MIARRTWLTFAVVVAASTACVRDRVLISKEIELGTRRVEVLVPTGWELLDHGKQKRFRRGELEIVLQNLGHPTTPSPFAQVAPEGAGFEELVEWGLAAVGHDQRRDVKSRRAVTIDGREAMDIETWNRLDHTNPQRIFFVRDEGELLALHTVRMASQDSMAAFEAIRESFHFVVSARR